MSRIRALLLFGGLTLSILGYIAWCSRTFWVLVALPDLTLIPENQRAAAEAAVEAAGLTKPDPFSRDLMLELLMKPYDTAPRPVISGLYRVPNAALTGYLHVYRGRRNVRSGEHPVIFFRRSNEQWVLISNPWGGIEYSGEPLATP